MRHDTHQTKHISSEIIPKHICCYILCLILTHSARSPLRLANTLSTVCVGHSAWKTESRDPRSLQLISLYISYIFVQILCKWAQQSGMCANSHLSSGGRVLALAVAQKFSRVYDVDHHMIMFHILLCTKHKRHNIIYMSSGGRLAGAQKWSWCDVSVFKRIWWRSSPYIL